MKKNIPTPLTDELLKSMEGMNEAETDPYFYTRLTAKMEKEFIADSWHLPVKPAWLLSLLAIFLFINSFFLISQVSNNKQEKQQNTTLQNFASEYNLTVSTSF